MPPPRSDIERHDREIEGLQEEQADHSTRLSLLEERVKEWRTTHDKLYGNGREGDIPALNRRLSSIEQDRWFLRQIIALIMSGAVVLWEIWDKLIR